MRTIALIEYVLFIQPSKFLILRKLIDMNNCREIQGDGEKDFFRNKEIAISKLQITIKTSIYFSDIRTI